MIEIHYRQGRFDICDLGKREWLFTIQTDHGKATVVSENEPELPDGFGVEDAVFEMRRIFEGFWIHTGRDEALKVCDAIMKDLPNFELEWHEKRTQALQNKVEQAQKVLADHLKTLELLRQEVAAEAV